MFLTSLQATLESMKHTIEHMPPDCRPSHVLIDGNRIPKVCWLLHAVVSMFHVLFIQVFNHCRVVLRS